MTPRAVPSGDGVEEGHGGHTQEGGDGLGVVGEVHLQDGAHHEEAHHHQSGGGGEGGDGQEDGGEEEGQAEEGGGEETGEAGAAALGHTGGTLGEGGDGGGAQHGAGGGAHGVGEKGALQPGQSPLFVQQVGLGGHAHYAAQSVKEVHKEEGKDH